MHFLLVNDDGIHAPGIRALCDAAIAAGHRVSICAPDRERSGASHSITITETLQAQKVDYPGAEAAYSTSGSPADCARLGLCLIHEVDAVISGINNGSNIGNACIYSGTVGAATEASMAGVPALASSLLIARERTPEEFADSARLTVQVAEWMMAHPLSRGEIYNLNVPCEAIRGVRAATLCERFLEPDYYCETENQGEYRYDFTQPMAGEIAPESDVALIRQGYATLSKLTWNLLLNAPFADVSDLNR